MPVLVLGLKIRILSVSCLYKLAVLVELFRFSMNLAAAFSIKLTEEFWALLSD